MATRKLTGAQLKKFRSGVAALKQKGLIRKSIDARSQASTRYMVNLVNNVFKDVLSGKAAVVKTSSRKAAEKFKIGGLRTRGSRVVVPLETGAKAPHYRPKSGEIVGKVSAYGRDFKRVYTPISQDLSELPRGKGYRYTISIGGGFRSFDDIADLADFMFPYENPPKGSSHHPYHDWRKYVLVEHFDDESEALDDYDGEDF